MADLTIRTPQGSWLNICESEWYVRQRDNAWTLIDPIENEIRVRDSSNSVWLDVTCSASDASYCPPEALPECWPGFSGDFDGGRVEGGRIVSCGDESRTYSGMTDTLSAVGGNFLVTSSYSNGYLLPLTWAGGQAQVNEINVNPGPESGQIFMSFDPLGSNARLRVYQGCNLLADSNQQGFDFGVMYIAEDGPLFFRVDATQNAKWLVKTNYVNTDILTAFNAKAPCFGTFGARMRCIKDGGIYDGKQAYEAIHTIAKPYSKPGSSGGASAQTTVIDYNFSNPGTMRVFHGEREVASAKNVTGFGQLQFIVDGSANDNLIVRVEASDSIWNYSMYCAGQCGSFYNRCTPLEIDQSPMCGIGAVSSDTIIGAGAPQTTVYVDYSQTEGGKVYLVYNSDDEVQFIVYVNGVVVAGSQPQVGENSLTFEIYDSTDEVKIVVIGPCCPSWQFTITDAVPDPSIFIADATITRPAAGEEAEICFPVTLEYGYDEPIYLEYRTSSLSAYESAGATQLQFTPQSLIASNQVVSSFYEIYGSKVVVDAGIGRFKNGVITTGNRKYWQNMHSYLSEGRNSLIIVTGAAGTECSIGNGTNQIPNNGSTVIHYTSGNLNITYESLKDYEAVFLLSTHTTTGTGLQSSRLSTVTFRSILSFADSGRGLFLGCIDGSTASGVNSFSGYLGMEVRGRYSPAATTEDLMNTTLGYHEVRNGIGSIALGTTGAVVTSAINRGAEVENYCFEIDQGGGPTRPPTHVHPSQQTVYNSWQRWQQDALYAPDATLPSDSRAWTTQNVGGRVALTNTANTNHPVAIVSPEKFDEYTFEVTLSATQSSNDDDYIGVVLGSYTSGNTTKLLIIWRTRYTSQHRWDVGISTDTTGWTGAADSVVGVKEVIDQAGGEWNRNTSTRIRAVRMGNTITVYATPTYNENTQAVPAFLWTHTIDLTSPVYAQFQAKGSYGYAACSQARAMWSEFFFEDVAQPPANVIPTDYKQTSGILRIEPCQTSASICVPVCGSDLVGPDVHFRMNLVGSTGGFIADPYAVGTIKNNNVPKCEQNTSVAVRSNGLNYVVGRGAQGLYVDTNPANAGFQAVMDTTLTLNHASSYKFIFFGTDVAELFVDCALVARSAGGNKPTEATVFLYNGNHHLYINYYTNQGNTKSEGYAALAILDANNIVVHISTPAAYRGRVINAGKAPECTQFPDACSFTATHGVSHAAHGMNLPTHPQAQPIQSDAHPPMCAPANTKYLLRKTINFPVTGTYQVIGTGDDDIKILVDCKQVHSATYDKRPTSSFHATAGPHSVVIEYLNIPECTPGNVCFVFIQPGGNVFYQSNPEGWVSTQSALPQALYQSEWRGHPIIHISNSGWSGGTNYSWWCAERNINVPETGDYYIVSVVDDDYQLFIGCKLVSSSSINESWSTRETFRLTAGVQKMSMRVYNKESKRNNYVGFRIYRVGTNVLLYSSTAAGWTAARRDLDLSGMSN